MYQALYLTTKLLRNADGYEQRLNTHGLTDFHIRKQTIHYTNLGSIQHHRKRKQRSTSHDLTVNTCFTNSLNLTNIPLQYIIIYNSSLKL